MAREIIFRLSGKDYGASPVKLERKKIYGWTSLVATDRNSKECNAAYLSHNDSLIIPSGGHVPCWIAASSRKNPAVRL